MKNGLEDTLERVGRVLSDRYGITVICQGTACCTNGKVIYLPALPEEIPDKLMGAIRAYLDHEVGHIVGESSMECIDRFKKAFGDEAFGVLNTLEDLRVEQIMRELYAGCGGNLRSGYDHAVRELEGICDRLSPLKRILIAVFSRGSGREDLEFLGKKAYEIASLVSDLTARAVTARDTDEVYALSEQAWAIIKAKLPEFAKENSNKNDQDRSSEAPPDTGTDQNTPSEGSSDSSDQAGPEAGDAPPEEPEEEPGEKTDREVDTGKTAQEIDTGSPMGDLGRLIQSSVEQYACNTGLYRAWDTERDSVHTPRIVTGVNHTELVARVMPCVGGVRQRLLQSLKARSFARWVGDQDHGAINHRALHRLVTGTSGRVFRHRVKSESLSTAASLLIDLSGSMVGYKLDLARDSAVVFCEALDRLGIVTSVIGFSTRAGEAALRDAISSTGMTSQELTRQFRFASLHHTVFKHFEEPWRKVSSRLTGMNNKGLTPLGESLRYTALQLSHRPEDRKIILCLTDGRPAVGITEEERSFNYARQSIQVIERAGIEVVLIGIGEESVSALHDKHVVVNKLEDLPGSVIRQLQKVLLPGSTL